MERTRQRGVAWRLWLAVVAVCALLRCLGQLLGGPFLGYEIPYLFVTCATPLMILAGIRLHRPARPGGWLILALGQATYTAADVVYDFDVWSTGAMAEPTPGDLLYLSSYLLTGAAVLTFIRRRTPGWDFATAVDAIVVALSSGLLTWEFLVEPVAQDSALPLAAKLTEAAYPVLDLMLLFLAVGLVLGSGTRSVALHLLFGYLGTMFAADTLYAAIGLLGGANTTEPFTSGLWVVSLGMIAACALHPAMRDFDARSPVAAPDATRARLTLLTAAVLMVPGLQLGEHLAGENPNVPLTSSACAVMFLLVMARMAGLVAAQRRAADTDALTGARNRRFFEDALATECRRAARAGHGLGLLMIDIDHFKKINDTYGHPAGDLVLRELARRLDAGKRSGTVVARYGGEEFAALVPHVTGTDLPTLAERTRRTIADLPFEATDHDLLTVTASIGAAAVHGPAANPAELLRAADQALYAAKAAGRNRSVVAPTVTTPADAHT
ncbi:GGDEF domain-containing protein [Actinoplanes oblitus]|uniref:GGDEF domain-containing protein n=1 Tax=Actinoplanes oblitus TaxID=3040509 RepID=A0ABY8WMQ8_9ACTN|nr:GGDEF domain-containing protein [Actinoplanes oblitus]WIM98311.1 GGDEF domain-containing protein [Actinoplanes oblitus]